MRFLKPGKFDCPRLAKGRRQASVRWGRWRLLCRTGSRRESGAPDIKGQGLREALHLQDFLPAKFPGPEAPAITTHKRSHVVVRIFLCSSTGGHIVWLRGSTAYVLFPGCRGRIQSFVTGSTQQFLGVKTNESRMDLGG